MVSSTEKARENRLRRFAKIERYKLVKSARRELRAWDYGRWWLVAENPGGTVHVVGSGDNTVGGMPGLTLDEVEALLYGHGDDGG